jgi:hypothetical protein
MRSRHSEIPRLRVFQPPQPAVPHRRPGNPPIAAINPSPHAVTPIPSKGNTFNARPRPVMCCYRRSAPSPRWRDSQIERAAGLIGSFRSSRRSSGRDGGADRLLRLGAAVDEAFRSRGVASRSTTSASARAHSETGRGSSASGPGRPMSAWDRLRASGSARAGPALATRRLILVKPAAVPAEEQVHARGRQRGDHALRRGPRRHEQQAPAR